MAENRRNDMTDRLILFDGRSYSVIERSRFGRIVATKNGPLLGIEQDDDPVQPYLAVTLTPSRRFKTIRRATRFYATRMGVNPDMVVINEQVSDRGGGLWPPEI